MTAPSPPGDDKAVPPKGKSKARPTEPRPPNGEASSSSWREQLICTRAGVPRDCIANVAIALRGDPLLADRIAYDEMRERATTTSLPWRRIRGRRDVIDTDDLKLAEWLQLAGVIVKPITAAAGLQLVASENLINPLRDRLDGLAWDGVGRLDDWLTDYLGVEKTTYSSAVGRAWMISAVARVYEPGCQVDHTMILEGDQGSGKSTACRILALEDEWFTDEVDKLGSKDSAQDLAGKWIIELSELSSMRKSEIDAVKSYISRRFSHYRPSYGKRSEDFARRSVFIGTTNSDQYLADTTGNRRFWPVRVGIIDLAALRRDHGQLWAETVVAYHKGEAWHLDTEIQTAAAIEQERREPGDPWEELVLAAAEDIISGREIRVPTVPPEYIKTEGKHVTTNLILDALNMPPQRRGKPEFTRIGQVLRKHGWKVAEDRLAKPPAPRRWYSKV